MQKFDTTAPVTAVVAVPAGRIRFIAADRTDTTVEVLPANASKGRDVKAAEQTEVTYADGTLRIKTSPAGNQMLGASGSVEVTVQLPAGSHVEAKADAAELRAVGRLGDIVFEGANGAVKIDEAASMRLTAFGDVSVGRLGGPAQISTQKGDVRIAEAVHGAVVLTTQMGDVSVGAADGVSASLDASTGYGRIHNALKNTDGADAGLTIRATTAHGDITARSL
ncbi:DUF4097 domain-containing protein [Streptomyces peucetius]|uniref:DUF4097 domain-containing protein n=1 Tax=Streptomyces peucetius TaxID=1950 RepID=A0ABY6IEE4_STRPE|nr:DUF4097 domain-containing protein [Streptomyces peucetius]UYQ65382.1 DUF4097 domain-containing protein [Streptomyces peucetius]